MAEISVAGTTSRTLFRKFGYSLLKASTKLSRLNALGSCHMVGSPTSPLLLKLVISTM
jgi:hypothetical protein